MKTIRFGILFIVMMLSACAVVDQGISKKPMELNAKWALLPFANNTDVPQAGLRAESIIEPLMHNRGISNLLRYPPALNSDSLFEPAERKTSIEALKWAREQGVRYVVTGAVDEWHYKVGIDGEPAVGVALQVIDLSEHDRVVWSAVGAKSGWSRESLSGVAQKLLKDLLSGASMQ